MTARKSPAARKSRSTRTKDDLEEEIQELKAQLGGQEALDPQAEVLAKEHITKTREAVKGLSVDDIITKGAQFGLQAQRTVAELTNQISAEALRLRTLQDAINVETAEIERLYDIEVASASIKALIQEHEDKKSALELEMLQARNAWNEEAQVHAKAVAQRNQEITQQRQREQDDYAYKLRMERQKANDEFAQQMLLQSRQQADKALAFDRDINERLSVIQAQEKDLIVFKERVAGFDEEIAKKTAQAVAIATSSLKKDLTNDFALQRKDLEIHTKVLEQQKLATDEANAKLAQQVVMLTTQLESARAQVQAISEAALQSASGQVALSAVRETVKENGQAGGGRKS